MSRGLAATHWLQVLDCVVYAEQELLKRQPHLAQARVFVHFESTVEVGLHAGVYTVPCGALACVETGMIRAFMLRG